MIRDYMKELIPAPILSEKKGQGIQAADFAYCVDAGLGHPESLRL